MLDNNTIDFLKTKITNAVIIPHISADGDAVGSCSALSQLLDVLNIENHVLTCDFIPEYLKFMKKTDSFISFQEKAEDCRKYIEKADVIFMLDHNTPMREGMLGPIVEASAAKRVMIDHHLEPIVVDYTISRPEMSSTCETLFNVICEVWGADIINTDIANSLYAGINTDTGGFFHNSSRPETFRAVATLLEHGLDKPYVNECIYQMNNLSRLKLIGLTLHKHLYISDKWPISVMDISLKDLYRYSYRDGDLEGLVNMPLTLKNVMVSVQITQRKEQVKLSMRSKGSIPVSEWCKAYFNGGGHLNAAGGQTSKPFDEVIKEVMTTMDWFGNKFLKK